ncbi:hypothetical protein BDW02DRAFT_44554 [Decorospora gaudefroyi]|uniref:Zn(2)-C6 fungal-type domain-containing protein n=1 Tax=Decorospora gaudefroyi TaxID=184978 RepID=A0A6A5K1T4_9PLEO|nr:hypothetical protein BDW02DRAFT_44554 [Decorospora gaudefroyi]
MEYDGSRRCLPHNLSYSNYIYNERNDPLALSQNTRDNPRGYPVGGPVGGVHSRANMGREEPVMEPGPARRRIAVACARCRKRKIRCTGDSGTGAGCTNCRQAGVNPMLCQFHRVGSDAVQKVMENRNMAETLNNMANAHNLASIYSTSGNNGVYPRPMSTQQCPQLDTKTVYPSTWTTPYSEDTSPVDGYCIDQPAAYPTNTTPVTNTNMYGQAYRWTHPTARPSQQARAYYDQDLSCNGLPYSLNTGMSSLQLSLPERPHPRQPRPLESGVPQRQLPMPQPSPAQNSRNIVDQLQDARLRSSQAMGAASMDSRGSFAKPLLPWTGAGDNQINVSVAASADGAAQVMAPVQLSDNTDGAINYLPTTMSMTSDTSATSSASQIELNFTSPAILEGMNISAPATTYSYLRGNRPQACPSQMTRQNSQPNLYSFDADHTSKRNSFGGDASNNCTLVSGHQYTPLSHSQPQNSPVRRNIHRESCQNRNDQIHPASLSNLNTTY